LVYQAIAIGKHGHKWTKLVTLR